MYNTNSVVDLQASQRDLDKHATWVDAYWNRRNLILGEGVDKSSHTNRGKEYVEELLKYIKM